MKHDLEDKSELEALEPAKRPKIVPFPEYSKLMTFAVDGRDAPCFRSAHVGIHKFIQPSATAKNGQLKTKYSDFVVREVDEAGTPASLSKTDYTDAEIDGINGVEPEEQRDIEADTATFKELLGDELFTAISALDRKSTEPVEITEKMADADREKRKLVHTLVRSVFDGKLASNSKDGKFFVHWRNQRNEMDSRERKDRRAKRDHRLVLRFVLAKQNIDTIQAISDICKTARLPINKGIIKYAGTKDKRASSTQFCTTTCDARKILGVNKKVHRYSKYTVGNFEQVKEHINLGALSGNQFCLVIRNVNKADFSEEYMSTFKNKGFVNYFGLQRFGLCSPNPLVGLAILKSDYENAVKMMLYDYDCKLGNRSDVREAREIFSGGGSARDAAMKFHKYARCVEHTILSFLARHGEKNYFQALGSLPRNLKTLFGHSYQSWLFNLMVTERLAKDSENLIVGDLVRPANSDVVSIETEEDVKNHSLSDLVIPLIGYDVKIPSNLQSLVDKILAEHGLSILSFNHKQKDYKLPGNYRNVFVDFKSDPHFEYDFVNYSIFENASSGKNYGPDLQKDDGSWLTQAEIDEKAAIVEKFTNAGSASGGGEVVEDKDVKTEAAEANGKVESAGDSEGVKVEAEGEKAPVQECALRIKFMLPSSTYATGAIRELLHTDDVTKSFS